MMSVCAGSLAGWVVASCFATKIAPTREELVGKWGLQNTEHGAERPKIWGKERASM